MTEHVKFQKILDKATKAIRRRAKLKKVPYAILENGEIKLIYPDKRIKVIRKVNPHKKRD